MAAAADGPCLLSLICCFAHQSQPGRPAETRAAPHCSLHPLLPQELSWKGLLDVPVHRVSTQPFLSVLPFCALTLGTALVLLLKLMLLRLHSQSCSGPCCCAASSISAEEAQGICSQMGPGTHFFTPAFPVPHAEASLRPSEISFCLHTLVSDMKVAVTSSEDESAMIKAGSNVEMSIVRWQSWYYSNWLCGLLSESRDTCKCNVCLFHVGNHRACSGE